MRRFWLSRDEKNTLGISSSLWMNLTQQEKELVKLYREHRSVQAQNKQYELQHSLQFQLSRNRVLKNMGTVEYQKTSKSSSVSPTLRYGASDCTTIPIRFPAYQGTTFQFNQAGRPTEYPFQETEIWEQVPVSKLRFEAGDDEFFRKSDDLGWLMGWSPISLGLGGQFPREMMPGSLSSIRVMTGLDLLRFQSKIMFETISPYSGVINHLCNYVCGDRGSTIVASSKKDKKLAQDMSDYLEKWCIRIGFLNKIRASCNHLLVQGECFPRRWIDGRVTLTDPSWCRGPYNEIGQNPWGYGVFSPNWPFEIDTVGAYHIWYPSNDHETLSPQELFHAKLDSSVGPSAKRSVPLSYRIRPLLPMMETLIQEMGSGETKRQKIAYIISLPDETDRNNKLFKRGIDSPFAASLREVGNEEGFPSGMYNPEAGAWEYPQSVEVTAPPVGAMAQSGCLAYNKMATVAANAVGVASWMFGSDFQEASRATSLTASEPTVKTGKNLQRILTECWEDVAEAEIIYSRETSFPIDAFENGDVRIHIELPNVEVRDMTELYDRLSKQMHDKLKSPQHVAGEMGDDFEEEQELFAIAEAAGFQVQAIAPQESNTGNSGDKLPSGREELKSVKNN